MPYDLIILPYLQKFVKHFLLFFQKKCFLYAKLLDKYLTEYLYRVKMCNHAAVAELADAPDLGSVLYVIL